jgi:hypothetical protein
VSADVQRALDFRSHAKSIRAIAEGMDDKESREALLAVADDYDRMAAIIEQRIFNETRQHPSSH